MEHPVGTLIPNSPMFRPKTERLTLDAESIATDGRLETVRYVDAVQDALKTRMTQDERVVIMGQDIAEYGGVFKITGLSRSLWQSTRSQYANYRVGRSWCGLRPRI